jgi:phosphoribosyl 1,2-cyclic phosphate phosphodiesterase
MEINILGSGGNNPPPRPGCQCRICKEAREKKAPYYRTRASLYLPAQSILINTPADIREQLNRENIDMVQNLIITSWRPEHVEGLTILENLNYDSVVDQPIWDPINVFIPRVDGQNCHYGQLKVYQDKFNIVRIFEMNDCDLLKIEDLHILPVRFESEDGFYLIIYDNRKKFIYIPNRYKSLAPISEAYDPKLLICPCFYWQDTSIFDRRIINSSIQENETSFEEVLIMAENIRARKVIFTHIEEDFGMSYRDLQILPELKYAQWNLGFAYDGMKINL